MRRVALALLFAAALFGGDYDWNLRKGFPKPFVPADNPMTAAKVELGRHLFYDKRVSVNGTQACATCHKQELAFTDGRARAEGATGQAHPRSSMSLVNIAYAPSLTWGDATVISLEQQALIPMLGEKPVELGLKGREAAFLNTLSHDPTYQALFAQAFPEPGERYTLDHVTKAIAAFERSIISMRSPYDRYRWDGDSSAISDAAKRGELIFASSERGRCFQCHDGWNFSSVRFEGSTDHGTAAFFNTGVSIYEAPNRGLFEQTQRAEDMGRFRAPTLRNVAVTGPYMHDGSLPTLDAVIEHYAAGGKLDHPNKSRILRPLHLTEGEKRDLVEFLKSLTDEEMLHDPRWGDPGR